MTWSDITRQNGGNPLTKLPQIHSCQQPKTHQLPRLEINETVYEAYRQVFEGVGHDVIDADFNNLNYRAAQFMELWVAQDNFGSEIDLHGATQEATLFWLEYQNRNRHLYTYPLHVITGRGNHSRTRLKKDLAEIFYTGNDSTGILENLVLNWLKQRNLFHKKRCGNFVIY
jgi:DNA-nicking Smr family endonuclease